MIGKPKGVSALTVMLAGASLGLALASLYRVYRYLRADEDAWDELEAGERQRRWLLWYEPAPAKPLATSAGLVDAIEGATREMLAAPIATPATPATDGAA